MITIYEQKMDTYSDYRQMYIDMSLHEGRFADQCNAYCSGDIHASLLWEEKDLSVSTEEFMELAQEEIDDAAMPLVITACRPAPEATRESDWSICAEGDPMPSHSDMIAFLVFCKGK